MTRTRRAVSCFLAGICFAVGTAALFVAETHGKFRIRGMFGIGLTMTIVGAIWLCSDLFGRN
jgi:hypothetical protein